MANYIDEIIAEMVHYKNQREGILRIISNTFFQIESVHFSYKTAIKAFNKRSDELRKQKVTGDAFNKDPERVKQYKAIKKAEKTYQGIVAVRRKARKDYKPLNKKFLYSIESIKSELRARKGKFRNLKVESRANRYIKEIEAMLAKINNWQWTHRDL